MKLNKQQKDFANYVFDFYTEKGGIYPIKGVSLNLIKNFIIFLELENNIEYDSIDRERIREMICSYLCNPLTADLKR